MDSDARHVYEVGVLGQPLKSFDLITDLCLTQPAIAVRLEGHASVLRAARVERHNDIALGGQ